MIRARLPVLLLAASALTAWALAACTPGAPGRPGRCFLADVDEVVATETLSSGKVLVCDPSQLNPRGLEQHGYRFGLGAPPLVTGP